MKSWVVILVLLFVIPVSQAAEDMTVLKARQILGCYDGNHEDNEGYDVQELERRLTFFEKQVEQLNLYFLSVNHKEHYKLFSLDEAWNNLKTIKPWVSMSKSLQDVTGIIVELDEEMVRYQRSRDEKYGKPGGFRVYYGFEEALQRLKRITGAIISDLRSSITWRELKEAYAINKGMKDKENNLKKNTYNATCIFLSKTKKGIEIGRREVSGINREELDFKLKNECKTDAFDVKIVHHSRYNYADKYAEAGEMNDDEKTLVEAMKLPSEIDLLENIAVTPSPDAIVEIYNEDNKSILILKGKVLFQDLKSYFGSMGEVLKETIKNPKKELHPKKILEVYTVGIKAMFFGTRFIIETNPRDGTDIILVEEGDVFVQGLVSGKAQVPAGFSISAQNGILQQPENLSHDIWITALREIEAQSELETVSDCHSVVGKWQWFNGAKVECFVDGKCDANNGFSGRWKFLESKKQFEIRWTNSTGQVYIDTVSVNCSKGDLQGKNQFGGHISATRFP